MRRGVRSAGREGPLRPAANRLEWTDAVALAALLVAVVLYLSRFPHSLNMSDESIHLYDAKRLLGGAVMYRDVFNIITPGWMYLMAGAFGLFGTTIAVARTAAAVIHGLTAAAIYATCRGLGARRALSWLAPLLYLVIAQPAWPIASQHWLSTLLDVVVLWLCVLHLRDQGRWSLTLGLALGLFVGVQQPRAAITVVGVATWLTLDQLVERRYGIHRPWRELLAVLVRVAIGIAAVVVPLLAWLIARAGLARVWRALVVFALFDYHGVTHCPWGHVNIVTRGEASSTFPLLLKYLPLALIPSAARLLWALAHGRSRDEARRLLLLLVFAATSMLSIMYFPDFIHIAFIAPVFLVALAENLEWAAHRPPPRLAHALGLVAGAVLVAACAVRLHDNLVRQREAYRFSRASAFGRVEFNRAEDALLYDRMKELMQGTPSRYLYCYPVVAHLYLLLDVDNPTAHGFFIHGLSGPDLEQEVLDSLTAKRPPYIVFLAPFTPPDDPVASWIRAHYQPIDGKGPMDGVIYRPKTS